MTPPRPVLDTQPIPFAQADSSAGFWPIITNKGRQLSYEDVNGNIVGDSDRRFLSSRDNGSRYHIGMDLLADAGDSVVACEDGQIVNFFPFLHSQPDEDNFALVVQHPKCVACYGNVTGQSLTRSGRDIGDFVNAGDVIGFIGAGGILHFETYQNGTIENSIWHTDDTAAPPNLLNPTAFLISHSQTPPLPRPAPPPPLASNRSSGTSEYEELFSECVILPARILDVDTIINRITLGQSRYQGVATQLSASGVPWYLVALIHSMEDEADLGRFHSHLYNGDPLTARTVNEPSGRPKQGSPPFDWEAASVDALKYDGVMSHLDWSVGGILAFLERYNGFGYRKFKINTPYLWSFSNIYARGKFDRDGHFNADLVSDQCGAAVTLKRLIDRRIIERPV
jgi:lysozyme family protein